MHNGWGRVFVCACGCVQARCRPAAEEAIASDACAEEIASAPMAKLLGILAFALLLHASTEATCSLRHGILSCHHHLRLRADSPCSKLPCCRAAR